MRAVKPFLFAILLAAIPGVLRAAPPAPRAPAPPAPGSAVPITGNAGAEKGQTWSTETLTNGLRVIYAPMPTEPATHVRVVYHVGSRDERPDRQGFAHMFEHMMFRGSAHVAPEEHMKLVGLVGGTCNAFTSFDETVYWESLPASYTELALWLEADRMSSFKVSPPILETERKVVAEEWRMRSNQPYGTMFDELMPVIFKTHPYRWTPIGNMQQLEMARSPELQAFFNHYYVPNNAILVVAGNIEVEKTREMVHRYFGWIPGSPEQQSAHAAATQNGTEGGNWHPIARDIPREAPPSSPRRIELTMRVPLTRILLAYRMPPNASDDNEKLQLLLSILGDGQSSRLYKALVTTDSPLCVEADSLAWGLEDGGVMGAMATMLNGKDPAEVEKILHDQIAALRATPVTPEELEKVKQQERMNLATRFETASKVASILGDEMLVHNNLDRVSSARERLEATTAADLQRVAQKYLLDSSVITMIIRPGAPKPPATAPATAAAASESAPPPTAAARTVDFPANYPAKPPMTGNLPSATFDKGEETTVSLPGSAAPIRVIVMEDHRMPIVSWSLVLRQGGHAQPAGKEGLASLTAEMVRRGPKGKTFDEFNEELESRAINLDVSDGGDTTRIDGSSLKELFPYSLNAARQMLLTPAFAEAEFDKLKNQSADSLRVTLTTPASLAGRQLTKALYGDSIFGRLMTLESLKGITLEDVRNFYGRIYHVDNAILMISGDITAAEGQRAAQNFLTGLPTGELPKVDYTFPPAPAARRIFLVDLQSSRQSAIRLGIPSYSIKSDEKFIGSLAGQMLSYGNESRLGKYVRAEKGYVYGVFCYFRPNRQTGAFTGETDTRFETTGDTLQAMFKVFDDMKAAPVPDQELADAKFRVSGQLLMSMETIHDQADRRIEGILNGYPIDYYDKYAERISKVTADQVLQLMRQYVDENRMAIVVVAPADKVKSQLEQLGTVQVLPPPLGE